MARARRLRSAPVGVGLAVLLLGTGCFYDSRWGEAKRAQQRNAARATPQALHAEDSPSQASGPAPRVYRVRFHATTAYTAQTVDWPRRTREFLDDANEILGASFRARLEVDTMTPWTGSESDKSLGASLADLQALDAGDDVDWVVGLVGGMSQLTTSFHELGMAPLLSKHLVIRATGKLDEHDGLDQAFNELNEEARTRLRRDRRRHRATAVFLHELGHTLGAMHEPNPHSLMFPQYRTDMEMFDEEAARWIGTSLAHRTDHRVLDAPDTFAKEVLPSLRTASGWVPQERDEMVSHLEQWAQPKTEQAAAPAPASAKEAPAASPPAAAALPADVATLPENDRTRLSETVAARAAGDLGKAWTTGTPLFHKYTAVYSIQELRCQLASAVGLAWTAARAECEPLMKLARGPHRTR